MNQQDHDDSTWDQKEQDERRLSETLMDIAECQKLLTEDPEYALWSEARTQEAIEQQEKEQK